MASSAPFAAFPRASDAAFAPPPVLQRVETQPQSPRFHAMSPRSHLHKALRVPQHAAAASASSSANGSPRHSRVEPIPRSHAADERYLTKVSSVRQLIIDGGGLPSGLPVTSSMAGLDRSAAPLLPRGQAPRSARSGGLQAEGASRLDRLEGEVLGIIAALRRELARSAAEDASAPPQPPSARSSVALSARSRGASGARSRGEASRSEVSRGDFSRHSGADSPARVVARQSSGRYMLPTVAAQLKRASSGADLRLERVSVSTTSLQSPRERSVPNAQRPARQRRRSPTQRHVPPSADEVQAQNALLHEELREAHAALQAQTQQASDASAHREQAQELEAFVLSLKRELQEATLRTALLEQRVASMGAASPPPGQCYYDGPYETGGQPEVEPAGGQVLALPPADVDPPTDAPTCAAGDEETIAAEAPEEVASPGGPRQAEEEEGAYGGSASSVTEAEAAEVPSRRRQRPEEGLEDLWEFVVQGRLSAPDETEGAQKGVTCFPAGALERLNARNVCFVCARGRRLDAAAPNQDDLLLAMCRCQGDGRVSLYGVFDGHGPSGHQCAAYARGFLPERIFGDAALLSQPEEVLRSAFREAHQGLLERDGAAPAHEGRASGTTATVALVLELPRCLAARDGALERCGDAAAQGAGTWVFIAHIGDSRAVLGSLLPERAADALPISADDIEATALTREHRPDDVEEAQGIRDRGGEVRKLSGRSASRVFIPGRSQPGLALTRVLGDTADPGGGFGVSSEPDVVSHLVRPGQDQMLLLGTDGFFEFCPPQEAFLQLLQQGASASVLEALCSESRRRWAKNSYNQTCDDATAIAVSLIVPPPPAT